MHQFYRCGTMMSEDILAGNVVLVSHPSSFTLRIVLTKSEKKWKRSHTKSLLLEQCRRLGNGSNKLCRVETITGDDILRWFFDWYFHISDWKRCEWLCYRKRKRKHRMPRRCLDKEGMKLVKYAFFGGENKG